MELVILTKTLWSTLSSHHHSNHPHQKNIIPPYPNMELIHPQVDIIFISSDLRIIHLSIEKNERMKRNFCLRITVLFVVIMYYYFILKEFFVCLSIIYCLFSCEHLNQVIKYLLWWVYLRVCLQSFLKWLVITRVIILLILFTDKIH